MSSLKGILAATIVAFNVAVNCVPLFLMGIVRVSFKLAGARRLETDMARRMDWVIDSFVGINRALFKALHLTRIEVEWKQAETLSRKRWYMVVSNHQTWTDILVLQVTLLRQIPPLKFFTKQQLIWIPLLGVAMWLLDFPYVRRMSREQIEAKPELLAIDRQRTLDSCEKIRLHPTSVLNFLEGTRFTQRKHADQSGRFQTLLNPKVGGLTTVLTALQAEIDTLVDVTIVYPHGVPTFWAFMKGECPEVRVRVEPRPIPAEIRTATDPDQRRLLVTEWVETLWSEKDRRILSDRGRPVLETPVGAETT